MADPVHGLYGAADKAVGHIVKCWPGLKNASSSLSARATVSMACRSGLTGTPSSSEIIAGRYPWQEKG